ncbi:MAG: hypothetical protein IIA01_04310 [Proteobacteria bacterium]|nr:hypothetical protein [Pseudomonadota bacterium]
MPQISDILDYGLRGEKARLIPTVADSQKERRAVSALLATLTAVDEFGQHMLRIVDAPATRRSRIECFTEVQARKGELPAERRPDGLIVVSRGQTFWSAFVEAKIGRNTLDPDQVEAYVRLARDYGVNAVITISNRFVPDPRASPIQINRRVLGSIGLYHWSWTSIVSEAILFAEHKGIDDKDQAFILDELIRYFQHESSGVRPFTEMPTGWRDVCVAAVEGRRLSKSDANVVDAVAGWVQLSRFTALQLTLAVGRGVTLNTNRRQRQDPSLLVTEAIDPLISENYLCAGFEVPNAAGTLWLEANLEARQLCASMSINAPQDKKRASAAITFLLRQLDECQDDQLLIDVHWPRRSRPMTARLSEIREDRNCVLVDRPNVLPKGFTIRRMIDLGNKIGSVREIVDIACDLVTGYYTDVGQNVWNWVPPAPKVVTDKPEDMLRGVGSSDPKS